MHSSVTISLLSSLSATELVVRVSSEGVIYRFEYFPVNQPCLTSLVTGLSCIFIHSLVRSFIKVKETIVIFTSSSCNIQIFVFRPQCLNAVMWWTAGVWYRVPLFTVGNKKEMHNFWMSFFCLVWFSFFPHKELTWTNLPAVSWCKWKERSVPTVLCSLLHFLQCTVIAEVSSLSLHTNASYSYLWIVWLV